MSPQTVVPRGTKGQGIVLWSSGRKPLLFNAIRVDTTIRRPIEWRMRIPTLQGVGVCQYCPLKSNRQVDDSNAQKPYQRVDSLQWSEAELRHGETD